MPEHGVRKHHLRDPDRAPPANIVRNPNLQLPFHPFSLGCEENLHFFDVVLEQRLEVAPIAEPEQGPELLLKLILTDADLPIDPFLAVFVDGEHVIEQKDGQLVRSFHLNLIRAEELDERGEIVGFIALLRRGLEVVSCIEGIAFESLQVIALVFNEH